MNISKAAIKLSHVFKLDNYESLTGDTACASIHEAIASSPLSRSLSYEAYDEANGLYHNKQTLGFVLELSPLLGASEETLTLLDGVIKDGLPDDSILQCLQWASPKIGHGLTEWVKARGKRGGVYQKMAEERASHLGKGAHQSLTSTPNFRLRNFRIMLSLTLDKSVSDVESKLMRAKEALVHVFSAVGSHATVLMPDALLSLLDDLLNPSFAIWPSEKHWDEARRLGAQVLSPQTKLTLKHDGLLFEGRDSVHVSTFSVEKSPTHWYQMSNQSLLGSEQNEQLHPFGEFVINTVTHIMPRKNTQLRAVAKAMNARRNASGGIAAKIVPSLARAAKDWDRVGTLLEEGGRLYKSFYHVLSYSPPHEANRAEDALLDVFRANGWILARDKAISKGAYLAMLPMQMDSKLLADLNYFERLRTVTSFNICNLLPLQGEWKGVGAPSLLLFGRRGQICWWDNFANREGNYNVAVTGKSRSGKSVLMQDLAASVVGAGGRAFIFDVGRSFEKACKFLGGQFIEFRSDRPICINPFTQIVEFEESINMLLPVFGQMVSSKEELSELQEAFLQEALKKIWMTHGNQGNASLVADWLKSHPDARAQDLGTMLYPYTSEGRYSAYVNGVCNLDFTNPYIVLELEELKQKKDLQSVVLMLLMYHVTEFMYRGDRKQRMLCIIDEAWDLMSGKLGGTFIEAGYRRAAKYNGAFVSGTQSLEDYEKSPAARAAKTNADTLMVMSQLSDVIEKADKNGWIDMSPHLKQTLKSVKTLDGQYAEVCVKTPSGYAVNRLLLDPFSRILYSSKGQDYADVNDLLAQGIDIETAVSLVAKRAQTRGTS